MSTRESRTRDGLAALAGLAAGAVTVGVGSLVALFTGAASDPINAVGATFVDATPLWLKEFATSTFGTDDKLVLGLGEVLVLALLAAVAGVLAARRWAWGATLVVLLAAVSGIAAMSRPDTGTLAAVPSVAAGVAGLVSLRLLVDRLPRVAAKAARPTPAAPDPRPVDSARPIGAAAATTPAPRPAPGPDRRAFLQATAAAASLGVIAAFVGRAVGATGRAARSARAALRLPAPATTAAPVPTGVQVDTPGMEPWETPPDDFYRIDTALVVPQVDPSTWELRVHGLVEQEVTLTWDELLASELVEAWVTLCCVSNPVGGDLIGNQRWLGLPIREVLARAKPHADADMVLSKSSDGFTASTPIEALTDDRDALLAIGMDGEPLPIEHGFPVRMVVPGLYGYVSATKWVVDLEVTRFADKTSYWTDRGWSPHGPVKTQSRISVPRYDDSLKAGEIVVAGTSWAQHRGVTRVQVRVDSGPWVDVDLADDGGIDSWRQWSYRWQAEPGRHTLLVRAYDPDGVQSGKRVDVVPNGAEGYDQVQVTVA
ncbi:molybdopterin-dependent oxidoreductase [Cellulomonas sp. PhB150]|uniref:molybdopterin-dependent oxidoreductase n=1 Tax=Cellulomonas sp. PhB150 TaxID=2485188 RepID=UPI000F465D8C|nr:molybdopterin-dependent oxidoreductase [Cellulomonas sp. PhB150]ROS31284.1 DMSO/TMAO reductase YedYZ molybdopterin-dependent catalytic subunit [Cellulomonas sp. PhB150]